MLVCNLPQITRDIEDGGGAVLAGDGGKARDDGGKASQDERQGKVPKSKERKGKIRIC